MAVRTKPKQAKRPLCQICGKRLAVSRGDCAACLRGVHFMLESGELKNEQEAIKKKLLLPAKKPGRPLGNAVRKKLAKAS